MESRQNPDEPSVLYKYIPAERALEVLPASGNGTLRATQPAALNDPLECATRSTAVYPSEDVEVDEMVKTLSWIVPEHSLRKSEVQLARRQLGTQAWNELFKKQLSRRLGVVSFSLSPLHPLLWAHYADSGAGFVVGYDVSVLKTLVNGYEKLGAVQYSNEPPLSTGHVIWQDEGNLHGILLSKASYWEYEQEWRLTRELKNTVGTSNFDGNGCSVNLCPIPNEAVKEVYFTERTPSLYVNDIDTRLSNPSNRFGVQRPRKIVLASQSYGYAIGN